MTTLIKLATLLHHRLKKNGISTWLPDFSVPMESQVHNTEYFIKFEISYALCVVYSYFYLRLRTIFSLAWHTRQFLVIRL